MATKSRDIGAEILQGIRDLKRGRIGRVVNRRCEETEMGVHEAIQDANAILPGVPSQDDLDPRWQAVIRIGEYIESDPEPIWEFICRWGDYADEDLRMAIATCLLEHLLEYHFAEYFPRVKKETMTNELFSDTFLSCWQFGQAKEPANHRKYATLVKRLRNRVKE